MPYPTQQEFAARLSLTKALSEETIARRAVILAEDIARINMSDFAFCPLEPVIRPDTGEEYLLVEYTFGSEQFGINNARNPFDIRPTVNHMGGSGLDRGELLYLSRVFQIARTLIPKHWSGDKKLLAAIRSPTWHLATLNEIWWLARWHDFEENELTHEYRQNPLTAKTIDWRFSLNVLGKRWFFNVEVKDRLGSISDRSYNRTHAFYRSLRGDGSEDASDPRLKFCTIGDDEINVLAITWYDQISCDLETEIQRFLDESDVVDVVAVWAPGDRVRGGWRRLFPRGTELSEKRRVFNRALRAPDAEDQTRIMRNLCPVPLQTILNTAR